MAGKHDGGFFLDDPASRLLLLALVGLIWFQGESLRSEIRALRTELHTELRAEIGDLRTEMRAEMRGLHTEVRDLCGNVNGLHAGVRSLRTEIDDLHGEVADLHREVNGLRAEVADLNKRIAELEVAVARIEVRRALRLMLALRFAASGEGASVGGPTIAAGLLLARAQPEIDSILSAIDQDARSELANDLWEDRANILARAAPSP